MPKAKIARQLAAPPAPLARLVVRLAQADRITNEWRKKNDAIMLEVGTAMREERKRCNISLRSLAKQIGCSAPFLSDLEIGNRKYSIEWCRKAMAILQNAQGMAAGAAVPPLKSD